MQDSKCRVSKIACKRPNKIDPGQLRAYIEKHPDAYLVEIGRVFKVSDVGILKACLRLGISRKKTGLYRERDEVERATFASVVRELPPEKIIWVDETGVEEPLIRLYGRNDRGKHLYADVSGKRVARTTLIAGYGESRLKAPMRFKACTNTEVFNTWCRQGLAPELRAGDVVIMDNATFHKSNETRKIIEDKGACLLFQSKYSPDLNKSEPQWANLKHHI